MHEPFALPEDEELAAVLGVVPTCGDHVGVRHIALRSQDGLDLATTTDALGRSVSVQVIDDGQAMLSLFRESATELTVCSRPPEFVVNFRIQDMRGQLEISLSPMLHISECTFLT